jgi:ABC-type uncharacterized transport system permease subunit
MYNINVKWSVLLCACQYRNQAAIQLLTLLKFLHEIQTLEKWCFLIGFPKIIFVSCFNFDIGFMHAVCCKFWTLIQDIFCA